MNASKCFLCVILLSFPINHVRKELFLCPFYRWEHAVREMRKNGLTVTQLVNPELEAHACNHQVLRLLPLFVLYKSYHSVYVYFQIIL